MMCENAYFPVHIHPEAANLLKIYYRSKALLSDRYHLVLQCESTWLIHISYADRSTLHNLLIHSKNYFEAGKSEVGI
jgi:hypothetical protein